MAQRDQVAGALGAHDGRQPRHAEHVALGCRACRHHGIGSRLHPDGAAGHGHAPGLGLGADIDHMRTTGGIEMGQIGLLGRGGRNGGIVGALSGGHEK